MKSIYKPTEYEMKLIVLYVILKLKTSATYTILDYVISSVVDMNYFALEEYIRNLIDVGDVSEVEIEKDRVYTLSASGEETIGFFEGKIPYSIREKLEKYIKDINVKANPSSEIVSDYYPINEKEYGVSLAIKENGVQMFNLEVYIGDKESARKTAKKLGENVNDIYGKILGIINDTNEM